LKQENLDLKLTPYKVIATGTKEGFLQFVDAMPVSQILANSEYKSIKEYLRKNNPSDTDRHGITADAMDAYVRSSGEFFFPARTDHYVFN
jgi:phosphatidylinositol 3-kinase